MKRSAALSDKHPDPAKRRDGPRTNVALYGMAYAVLGGGFINKWFKRGGSNKGSWESQKVGEDAPLARSVILFDLGWGELTNTRTPCFLRKGWETRPKLGARAWQGG